MSIPFIKEISTRRDQVGLLDVLFKNGGITVVGTHQSQSQSQFQSLSFVKNSNLNLNIEKYSKLRLKEEIADKLVIQFNNPDFRGFYWNVANKLPEGTIWNLVEQASKGKNPSRYFTYLCKKAGV